MIRQRRQCKRDIVQWIAEEFIKDAEESINQHQQEENKYQAPEECRIGVGGGKA